MRSPIVSSDPALLRRSKGRKKRRIEFWAFILAFVVVGGLGAYFLNDRMHPRGPSNELEARRELRVLSAALEEYRETTGEVPTTAQGLAALMDRPETLSPDAAWKERLISVPPDPWGVPYVYRSADGKTFDLFSLGPDGKESADDIREEKAK